MHKNNKTKTSKKEIDQCNIFITKIIGLFIGKNNFNLSHKMRLS